MAKWYKPKTLWGIIAFWIVLPTVVIYLFMAGVFQEALGTYDFTHYPVRDGILAEQELMFGDHPFLVSPPRYSEECDQDGKYFAPSPSAECWYAEGYYQGKTYELPYDEDVEIAEWLTVKWETDALVDDGELEDFDRTDSLKVQFDADTAFEFSADMPSHSVFGEEAEITLDVTNNMGTADVIVEIEEKRGLFNIFDTLAWEQTFSSQTHTIGQGVSELSILVSENYLGEITYSLSLIPSILYSEGTYQESTEQQEVSTTVLSEAAVSGEFEEELEESEDEEGTSILLSEEGITADASSLLDSIASATKALGVVLTLLGAIAVYLLYLIILKSR